MKQNTLNIIIASLLVVIAAISRVLLYPDSFSPIIGMAIFAGAIFKDKRLAFALPIFAMLLSDVIFEVSGIAPGFWGMGQIVSYGILALITVFAFRLKKLSFLNITKFSLTASVIFFILSNLFFFLIDNRVYHTYTQDFNGLQQCFLMALPFFRTAIVADLVFSFVLFGSYFLINRLVVKKQLAPAS